MFGSKDNETIVMLNTLYQLLMGAMTAFFRFIESLYTAE